MYCEHCGKEITQDGKFCEHCGKPLSEPPKNPSARSTPPRKRFRKLLIILGIWFFLPVLVGFFMRDEMLNPRNYIGVEVTGTSGSGRFYYTFDPEEELYHTLLAAQTKDEKDGLGLLLAAWELEKDMKDAIQIDAVFENTENGKLSNGDVVKLMVKVDQKYFKQFGCSFTSSQYELKYEIGKDLPALQSQ